MMFGTEFPTIDWQRGREEVATLSLRANVAPRFFQENAKRAFDWQPDLS